MEWIRDHPWSPFPTVDSTERPDRAAAALAEGRVAVFADGSPTCLLAPGLFVHFLQSQDDYLVHPWLATALRLLRLTSVLLALTLPGAYIALTTIHQELIPTLLATTLSSARLGVPFPPLVEILVLEFFIELVREAGLHMPKGLGQTVTIAGTLVVGEAAVRAGFASAPAMIVTALTLLASFTLPKYSAQLTLRLMRFAILFIASGLGLMGVAAATMLLLTHLASMQSFGTPYLAPLAPMRVQELADTVVRLPRWLQPRRPRYAGHNQERGPGRGGKPRG